MGVPSLIHEQNAVMGRANKALASRVQAIAGGFLPDDHGAHAAKTVTTGNPVRPAVLAAAEVAYHPSVTDGEFRLVVFGGSQGAQFFSKAVPQAVCRLGEHKRTRLRITQQARPEDREGVEAIYAKLAVPAEVSPFFGDMAQRIAQADLVISRSGASTVSELSVIGRPSVLVPYPHALDHDQAANAAALSAAGGSSVIKQPELSPKALSALLADAMNDPVRLEKTAAAAKATGQYINSVLAKVESLKAGYDEAVMLNEQGYVTDGSGENLFIVRDGRLTTPPISAGCLDGITRGSVITIARDLGFEVTEENLIRTDLYNADECFFTGTAAEITPIREVDDRAVGEGHRGPVTKELQGAFFAATKGETEAYVPWLTYVND